jgi:hypothetical protein
MMLQICIFKRSGQQLGVNTVSLNFITQNPLGKAKLFGGFSLLAAGFFQGVDYQLFFLVGDNFIERLTSHLRGFANHLKRGRQMFRTYYLIIAKQDRPLDTVFQFPDIAGPMIACKHFDCGC